ncbi:DnaJ chaperone protein [Trypanosoma conorhini]|uniref:DnaJ chaperone protein n=1 Tax=Trypanosoma conorhini TaxID=83891 RepID=A0A3R7L4T4_9TRYP|nr:DnaJ chaperone protein [Trypanosoma conorhini]RNF19718.1 DnaJ chaperone protein [Trypanosoma conorhini]
MSSNTVQVQKETILRLSYYEIFSLDPSVRDVDFNAVHRAYRRFALLFHPDKDSSPAARLAFERVKLAAETLTDPLKRREYDEAMLQESHRQAGNGASSAWQQQQREEMEEEARVADMILRQKEAATAARAAATREEEREKEAAAKQMLHELTNALTTPFKRMEAELVHEWDIDEDLLRMKEKEVEVLLQKLRGYNEGRGRQERPTTAHVTAGKRGRCE